MGEYVNLIGMTQEELDAEYDAYEKYVNKYCHYKHYKDIDKIIKKREWYIWGLVSKNSSNEKWFNEMLKTVRRFDDKKLIKVTQSINQLNENK